MELSGQSTRALYQAKRLGRKRMWRKTILPWLFVAPLLFFNAVVILGPSVGSAYYAFTEWSGLGPAEWVGLANFKRLLQDRVYHIALVNNLTWTLIFLTVPVAMGLLGSALLSPIKRGQMLYRIAYFIPYVIASVVNVQIWRNILHPIRGIGVMLAERGLTFMDVVFFGNRDVVLYSVAGVDIWHWWGFLVVLYLAAMQAINIQLYEAARIEGASRWQEFRHVTLPGILPTLVFTLLMTIIWSFLVFDYIYLLTQGGAGECLGCACHGALQVGVLPLRSRICCRGWGEHEPHLWPSRGWLRDFEKDGMGNMSTLFAWKRQRRAGSLLPYYVVLTLLLLFSLLPIGTLVSNSLKTTAESKRNPLGLPLHGIEWQNYPTAWTNGRYSTTARNSAIITVGTVTGVLIIAGLAAYSMAMLDLPGANGLAMYLLVGTSMPAQLFMVPLFFLWTKLGLTNSLLGVIIIYWATLSPFATFLLRSFMVAIPGDFSDAARIDGASELQVMRHVIMPIIWPGFLTSGLVAGLAAWNEFLFAVTFLHSEEMKPVSTSLYAFVDRYTRDWGLTSAASVIMIAPVIVIFLLFQRQFIEGLTQGGLKA